jgi:hypothetical protein
MYNREMKRDHIETQTRPFIHDKEKSRYNLHRVIDYSKLKQLRIPKMTR